MWTSPTRERRDVPGWSNLGAVCETVADQMPTPTASIDGDAEPVVIVVHTVAHAVGALAAARRAGRPVTIVSAPDAGIYAGR
jgi:hypothetical protein